MSEHATSFFLRTWRAMPTSVGTNWLGLLLPFIVTALVLLLSRVIDLILRKMGKPPVFDRKATLVTAFVTFSASIVALGMAFGYDLVVGIYQDHKELVADDQRLLQFI